MHEDRELVERYRLQIVELLGQEVIIVNRDNTPLTNLYYLKDSDEHAIIVVTGDGKTIIASFSLSQLPGCCAYMVSYHSRVYARFRNKGLGYLLNTMRIDIARFLGYTALMCTDVEDNTYQRKILERNGWKDVHKLRNKRTRNNVFLSIIDL